MRSGLILVSLVLLSANAFAGQAPTPASTPVPNRTKAEVDALIAKDGPAPPDWWNNTPLNFPKTLDLTMGPPKTKNWDPNANVGQYFWSTINENPSKWKEGVKFAAHLLTLNKDDEKKAGTAMHQMAHLYKDCLNDYSRAAYWLLQAGEKETEDLAYCYYQMGAKDTAKDLLTKVGPDYTRHGTVIKMWSDLGEYETALKLADAKAKDGSQDIAYLMAGDACRKQGKFKEALDFYAKVLTADPQKVGRDFKQSKDRAQANIDAVKLFDTLDLSKVPDGAYTSSSVGYTGPVKVEVTMKGGKIADIKITDHHEKQFYGAITETPRRIIEKQSVKGIDTFSSATITSEAIINATAKALSAAMK